MLNAVARRPLHLHAEQSRLLLFLMLGREERIGTAPDIDYPVHGHTKGKVLLVPHAVERGARGCVPSARSGDVGGGEKERTQQ